MDQPYTAPTIETLGTVEELTQSFDKIGSTADVFTPTIPLLDGDIQIDP
jgi:hypothetical protein